MPKIILLSGDSSTTGAPSHIYRLALGLKSRNLDVMLIAPKGPLLKLAKAAGIMSEEVPMGGPFDKSAFSKIHDIVSDFKPDLIHFHGVRGGWLGRLATRNIKSVKKIYTEHLFTKYYHLQNSTYENFQLRGLKFLDRWTDKTICVSKAVYDFLVSRGFEKKKLAVISNGINPEFFSHHLIEKPPEMPVILGSVGSLNQVKNYRNTILGFALALKNNPELNMHYRIVGEGPLEKSLKELVKKKKISEMVHFAGRVDNIFECLEHFTIFINTSLSESFGLACAEAMAVGLPAIVSNFGGLKELVSPDCALSVNPRNPEDIAKAISRLAKDPSMRKNLGQAGRKRVFQNYTEEKMIDKTIKVYEEVLGKK